MHYVADPQQLGHIAARTLDVLKERFSAQSRASHWQRHHSQESFKLEQVKIFCSAGVSSLLQRGISLLLSGSPLHSIWSAWGWSTSVWRRRSVIAQIKEQFLEIECRIRQLRAGVCDLVVVMTAWLYCSVHWMCEVCSFIAAPTAVRGRPLWNSPPGNLHRGPWWHLLPSSVSRILHFCHPPKA